MAASALGVEASRALRGAYRDLFLLAGRLYDGRVPGSLEGVAKDARSLLNKARQQLLDARVPEHYIKEVSLAVTFMLDEAAMNSPEGATWLELQAVEEQRRVGGDEFFERLKRLRSEPRTPVEVLEIFARCLDWGFVGPYRADERKEELEEIRDSLEHDLKQQLADLPPLSQRLSKTSGLPPPLSQRLSKTSGLPPPSLSPLVAMGMAVVLVALCSIGGAVTTWWSAQKTAERIQAASGSARP